MTRFPIFSPLWPIDVPVPCAQWIAPSFVETTPNIYFRARRHFIIDDVPESAVLLIGAESQYRLWVNGVSVGRGPVRGTAKVNFFDGYNIESLLQLGDNWIAVEVHSPNIPTFKAAPAQPALLVQIEAMNLVTDANWQVQLTESWRQDVPLFTFQIGYMEWRDLRAEPKGWQTGADGSVWREPAVLAKAEGLAGKALRARDIPPLRETKHLPVTVAATALVTPLDDRNDTSVAKRMTEEVHAKWEINATALTQDFGEAVVIHPTPGGEGVSLIFDFRHEVNGRLEIELDAPAGAILDVGYEEELTAGRLSLIHYDYRFADRNVLREGRQIVGDAFAERGFRVAQIVLRDFHEPVHIHRVRGVDLRYPFTRRGTFTCSDALLNAIWDRCAQTIEACTTDTFVDCPWRENAFYLNDMLVENLTALQIFGDTRIGSRCFRLAASQVRSDGLLPAPVPFGGGKEVLGLGGDRMVFPATQLFLPQMLEEHLFYGGDASTVGHLVELLPRILQTFASWEDEVGLICPPVTHWNFIDWSYPQTLDGRCTATLNWLYVNALDTTARLLKFFGEVGHASFDAEKSARVAAAIDARFWSDNHNCYQEYETVNDDELFASQVGHAVALLTGRVPLHRQEATVAALEHNGLISPELYMHYWVLRALVAGGQPMQALERVRRYWGPIVTSGSPTIWECGVHSSGKTAFDGAGSLCHGFSTSAVDFLQSVILGVRPLSTGFERCLLSPQSLDLGHAEGSVPTPHGNLDIAWKRDGRNLLLEVRIPSGTIVVLPDGREIGMGWHQERVPC